MKKFLNRYWVLLWIVYVIVGISVYPVRTQIEVSIPMMVAYVLLLALPGILDYFENRVRA